MAAAGIRVLDPVGHEPSAGALLPEHGKVFCRQQNLLLNIKITLNNDIKSECFLVIVTVIAVFSLYIFYFWLLQKQY